MPPNNNQDDLQDLFILRRAFRSPDRCVTRAHLKAAFPLKDGTATARLNACLDRFPQLQRQGNKITPALGAESPIEAGVKNLLDALSNNVTDFSITGLTEKELPFRCRKTAETMPKTISVAEAIVNAVVRGKTILVLYVTMRRGDQGKWRRIFPLGLEKVGDQLRVDAQDLGVLGHPIRSFVMTRVIGVQEDPEPLPRGFIQSAFGDNTRQIEVNFSSRLTDVQRGVLAHEFGVRHGKMKILDRAVYEFRQMHSGRAVGEDVVHPVFEAIGVEA